LALVVAAAVAVAVVSGGSDADPQTPPALPGLPPPFLGTAVVGSGGLTAAIDAYGDVVDLRAPGPAGGGLIDNPAARQAAGSVPADTGIVPRVSVGDGPAEPLWRADSVSQRYLPGTNVVRTVARFGQVTVAVTDAATGETLARTVAVSAPPGIRVVPTIGVTLRARSGARCERDRQARQLALVCSVAASPAGAAETGARNRLGHRQVPHARPSGSGAGAPAGSVELEAEAVIRAAGAADRRWLAGAKSLGPTAPAWARRLYGRSLLTLRALTDRRSGAVAAGARDGWAYVWPRDAGTAAIAFASAGYRSEARRTARFLGGLDIGAAARFYGDGTPVPGRGPQGDATGWVAAAARAAGLPSPTAAAPWRELPDYQEGAAGDYLANAIASVGVDGPESPPYGGKSTRRPRGLGSLGAFETSRGLVRRADDPGSGLDSAAAWAVRPFPRPPLFPAVSRTLLTLAARQTRFGITPSEDWTGSDPWTAPTAWSAWSLAALADAGAPGRDGSAATSHRGHQAAQSPAAAHLDRRAALRLLGDLRRAATPTGELPERVGAHNGVPVSTTPLAWSHALAILALRQLWPGAAGGV
jgi:hypothetical protein